MLGGEREHHQDGVVVQDCRQLVVKWSAFGRVASYRRVSIAWSWLRARRSGSL